MGSIVLDNVASIAYFWPETLLSLGVLGILTVDLFAKRPSRIRSGGIAVATLIAAILATLATIGHSPKGLFGGLIAHDPFTDFFRIFFFISTSLVGIAAMRTRDAIDYLPGENQDKESGEFY